MKTLKEMFTRKKIKRYWILESECPVEMVSYVVDTLERVGVKTSVSSYHCDSKVKIIAAEFVLDREETDNEVITRAESEFEEHMKQYNEIVGIYCGQLKSRELVETWQCILRHMDSVFGATKELFRRDKL